VKFSVSSQISRYSFATSLIEDEIDHETVDSSVVIYSWPSEFPSTDYVFMVNPTESSSSESPEFISMIQQVIFSASSFTGCVEFIPESSLPLAGFDVCHIRHPIYLLLSSLGVMSKVPTVLYLYVAHDDDITRQLANCAKNYKFVTYSYSIL